MSGIEARVKEAVQAAFAAAEDAATVLSCALEPFGEMAQVAASSRSRVEIIASIANALVRRVEDRVFKRLVAKYAKEDGVTS